VRLAHAALRFGSPIPRRTLGRHLRKRTSRDQSVCRNGSSFLKVIMPKIPSDRPLAQLFCG
jgi:hypothetical protein